MNKIGCAILLLCIVLQLTWSVPAQATATLASCNDAAALEGVVQVSTTTEPAEAAELLEGFRSACPQVQVIYRKMNSGDLYNQVVVGVAVDLAWSSAVDLQIKLVNDGYAQPHRSTEVSGLPAWAVWRDEAYGTTAEPVTIVYNRKSLPSATSLGGHQDLTRLLTAQPDALKGRVATYDPERSGSGFLFITQDLQATRHTWDLVHALGQAGVKLYTSTDAMLDGVAAGDLLLAYNVIGSYALARAAHDPVLAVVLPSDYTLIISRVAFITRTAPHPNAARAFLDYILSSEGQRRLATGFLYPVRQDMQPPTELLSHSKQRPIRIGPGLLTYLDQAKRLRFIREWRRNLQGQPQKQD